MHIDKLGRGTTKRHINMNTIARFYLILLINSNSAPFLVHAAYKHDCTSPWGPETGCIFISDHHNYSLENEGLGPRELDGVTVRINAMSIILYIIHFS